jgi:NADPH:quinone reductase-like Zn-dependent oxidoreductase
MKLYRVTSFGNLDGLCQLEEPQPTAPVARQVLVRVRATSLNFRDVLGIKGALQMGTGMAADHIPLCDGAGEVVAVGSDVTRAPLSNISKPVCASARPSSGFPERPRHLPVELLIRGFRAAPACG